MYAPKVGEHFPLTFHKFFLNVHEFRHIFKNLPDLPLLSQTPISLTLTNVYRLWEPHYICSPFMFSLIMIIRNDYCSTWERQFLLFLHLNFSPIPHHSCDFVWHQLLCQLLSELYVAITLRLNNLMSFFAVYVPVHCKFVLF